jgi:hypothetical protein
LQVQVIDKTLAVVDERADEIRQLNETISSTYDGITTNIARQQTAIESDFSAAYNGLLPFVRLASKYAASDADIVKSSLSDIGKY